MMKHLFFDLDRTLWDFEKNSEQALKILFDDLSLHGHFKSFQSFHKTYKNINAKLWQQYGKGKITKDVLRIKRFDDTLKSFQIFDKELAGKLGEGYVNISPYQTNLFPNTIETLSYLKKEGFELHIITNGFKEVQYIKLEKSGLIDFFDVIVCSEEVGESKPAINVFNHSLKLADAKSSNSIMIGDDFNCDILGACNAGMQGILFDPHNKYKPNHHEWQINNLDEIPELIPWISKI